jgi:hypothetical protein
MSNQSTVHVSGIAPATSEKDVRDFFSFWYDDLTSQLPASQDLTNN